MQKCVSFESALTAPTTTDDFTAPATFSIVANAADSDGIAKVEFYNGASLLGTSTQSPYQYDWTNVPAGSYSLTAKAYDNATASATSSAVSIVVKAAPAPPGIYYIYADHLNTPRIITDSANTTVWSWNSDPFGTDVAQEDVDGDGRKFTYNLRFPGQYWDQETSLHYNYKRDGYDPGTGRYTQSDPLGLFGGSLSTYGYAANNPLSYTDPTGEAIGLAIPIGIGAIIIGATWWSSTHPVAGPSGSTTSPFGNPGTTSTKSVWEDFDTPPTPSAADDRPGAGAKSKPKTCGFGDRCEKMWDVDRALCQAIASRYGAVGVAICMKSAFQRYVRCLRDGTNGGIPLSGVETPL